MNTRQHFRSTKTTSFLWLVGLLIACAICLAVDAFVIPKATAMTSTSALIIIMPGLISMIYLLMLQIADHQTQIAELKREVGEMKQKLQC